jgi:oxygen-dependent protoporphyrinogen oxidase
MSSHSVVVVGGGITGLAGALFLSERGAAVTLVESAGRFGGKIWTEPFAGISLDTSADAFVARTPSATALCQAVGLGDDLVAPATGAAYVWTRGRLRALPAGQLLGVPTDLAALARSGLLSWRGTARAALDVVLPGRGLGSEDRSVADVVGRRLGHEAVDRLVDPLVGGINAGRTDRLSIEVTAPQLATAARARSLIRGARRARADPGPAPVFLTVRGGLRRLVDALAARLTEAGVELRAGDGVIGLERDGSGWSVLTQSGLRLSADSVLLTVPAAAAARLLDGLSPSAAGELATVATSSVALVTLAYARSAVPGPPPGSGFLVPRVDGRLLTAASWVNAKWPHLDQPETFVVRASAGRAGDDRALSLSDGELIDRLHGELTEAMGLAGEPSEARVHRWIDAFPQFAVGHAALVARVEAALTSDAPGLVLAGAALRGVGIPTCISGAHQAIERLLNRTSPTGWSPV